MPQQRVKVELAKPFRQRVLQALGEIQAKHDTIPAEVLRDGFAEEEQIAVTAALVELTQKGLIEPSQCVRVVYHELGFVLGMDYVPAYRLTEMGVHRTTLQAIASMEGDQR